ncbi:MFS transporter [Marinomonas sp. RSW2]|uniref:MFS transporter n=1 Tax=Marinomonas maritima TaxID=2940935 RepID=A0ABT5WIK6_9GAMM|nr:MFS transporter [Marinomonas maritima]MDE8603481.1 MFS transporter [Marinomonas maritima]
MSREVSMYGSALIACSAIMLALGSIVMIQPIFEELANSFQYAVTDIRLSFSLVSLSYAISFFLIGPLTDKFNLKRMAVLNLFGLAVFIALLSISSSFVLFNIAIIGVGVFAAGTVATFFPYMTKIAPPEKRGKYLGFCLSATVTGIIFGRAAIGLLTEPLGWQWAFLCYAGLVVFVCVMTLFLGAVAKNKSDQLTLLQQYIQSLTLLKNGAVLKSCIAGFMLFIAYLGILTFLTYHLTGPPFSFSSAEIGWVSFPGIIAAFLAPMAGGLAQKHGYKKVVLTGVVIALLSLILLCIASTFAHLLIGLLLLYSGIYICQPAVFFHITQVLDASKIGAASSFYLLACLSGGSFGSYFLGPVWFYWGWLGVSFSCAIAIILALTLSTFSLPQKQPSIEGA